MSLTQINKAGLDEIALDHVFTIGASGSSAYTFQGEGLNGTVNNPTLYLTRGKTYRFENGSGGHPIRIQSTSGASGTAYNTGITNNAGSGTVIVEVQHDAPDVLYYQCTSHAAMNGILYITGALADGGVTTAKLADDAVNNDKLANSVVASIAANTAKTSNATHTGDVTGSTSLTIANDAVTTAKIADDAVTTAKIADDAVTAAKIADGTVTATQMADNSSPTRTLQNSAVTTIKIADQAVTLDKLPHGTSSNDGKFLRANNGADPTFETVSIPDADKIIEGNTKAEVVDTGAGHFKVETDGSERFRVNDDGKLTTGGETSPDVVGGGLCLNTGAQDGIFLSCKNSDIAHGRTSLDETDTLFSMRKISGDKGGVDIRGYTDAAGGDPAIRIFGTIDSSSDAGYCPVELRGARKNTGGNTGTSGIPVDRGVVRISNDGDNTVATFTGEGLCFHSDTAAANALDDYEEGTFTPTAFGWSTTGTTSYNTQSGIYVKVGRVVHAWFFVDWTSLSNANGVLAIGGFPFTHNFDSTWYGAQAVEVRYINYSGDTVFGEFGIGYGTSILLYAQNDNNNHAYVGIDSAGNARGCITYMST